MRIKREGKLEEQYGKEKGKQVAFALATQQAHRLGKSPKKFKSKETGKMETFGTPQGRREAKMKYDLPKKEYQKTASEGLVPSMVRDLVLDILDKTATEEKEGGIFAPPMAGMPLKKSHHLARAIAKKLGYTPKALKRKSIIPEGTAIWG
jgi:hypothetical protein